MDDSRYVTPEHTHLVHSRNIPGNLKGKWLDWVRMKYQVWTYRLICIDYSIVKVWYFNKTLFNRSILQTNHYVNWLNNTGGLTNFVMEITRFFKSLKIPKEICQISTLVPQRLGPNLQLTDNLRLSQPIISKRMRLSFVLTYIGSEHIAKKFWIFQFVIFIETKLLIISIHCLLSELYSISAYSRSWNVRCFLCF